MKKLLVITILFLLTVVSLPIFAAETESNDNITTSFKGKIFLYLNGGIGLSRNISKFFIDSEIDSKLSFNFDFGICYFFMGNVGFGVDIGNHYFKMKEEDNITGNYMDFYLKYVVLGFGPIFHYKGFFFSPGAYFSFITSASYEGTSSISNDTSFYTKPNIGLRVKLAYMFNLSSKIIMLTGIELKTQLLNFSVNTNSGSKIFAAYLTIGFFVDLTPRKKTRREIADERLERYN